MEKEKQLTDEIITGIFPYVYKEAHPRIQEAQREQNTINSNKITPRNIVIKMYDQNTKTTYRSKKEKKASHISGKQYKNSSRHFI